MSAYRALHDLSRPDDAGDNRRRAGRFLIDRVSNSAGEIVDLSSTGAKFVTRDRWSEGERRDFVLESENARVTLTARCVWVRRKGLFRRCVGVEFIDMTPEDRAVLTTLATRSAKRSWGSRRYANDVNWDRLGPIDGASGENRDVA